MSVIATETFKLVISKIKDAKVQEQIAKQIRKISENPEIGKPLRYDLKGTRSVRVHHYRIIYASKYNKIYLLNFEHRKDVYN